MSVYANGAPGGLMLNLMLETDRIQSIEQQPMPHPWMVAPPPKWRRGNRAAAACGTEARPHDGPRPAWSPCWRGLASEQRE
jgi:hypothetical protein